MIVVWCSPINNSTLVIIFIQCRFVHSIWKKFSTYFNYYIIWTGQRNKAIIFLHCVIHPKKKACIKFMFLIFRIYNLGQNLDTVP